MGNMVQRAKSILLIKEYIALFDKGFHTGSELKTVQELGVEMIFAITGVPSTIPVPNSLFNYEFSDIGGKMTIHMSGIVQICSAKISFKTDFC
jgi:hypothetical protein